MGNESGKISESMSSSVVGETEEEMKARDAVKLPIETLRSRMKGCLWASFCGDALSMPVHWYYDPTRIDQQFGKIVDFQAPSEQHPGSVMQYHSTGRGGRGAQEGSIIGDVILHGKKQYWGTRNVHYHCGMKAGENTLNLQCLRVLMRSVVDNDGKYDSDKFLEDYIKFMTTPGTHNDTYAESYHRDFFSNWSAGKAPRECAGAEGHDTPSIGAFVTLPVVILLNHRDRKKAKELAVQHVSLTHTSQTLNYFVGLYVDFLLDVLHTPEDPLSKETVQQLAVKYGKSAGVKKLDSVFAADTADRDFIGRVVTSACYIDGSFPALCFLVGKYGDSVENCLIGNTNAGGENCHRGAACGSIVGAAQGLSNIPTRWIEGLVARDELEKEIDALVEVVLKQEEVESEAKKE
jgi:ADP-ribosyl-[dinitrogen reductase] hydrolase